MPAGTWRARLGEKRVYRSVLGSLTVVVAFAIFAHHALDAPLRMGATELGRQAFEAAFQRKGQHADTHSDSVDLEKPALLGPTYYDSAVYEPDLPNPTPLTEIGAKACLWPPTVWDVCTIDSSPREDASRGPWVRVTGDMDRRVGIYYNFLFYRRKVAYSSSPSIVDIKLLTLEQASAGAQMDQIIIEGWRRAEGNLRAGVWPRQPELNAWYRLQADTAADAKEPFTELEVVYGLAGHREGWEKIGTIDAGNKDRTEISLIGRRRPAILPKQPELLFSPAGEFTVLQLADFHFSTETGACRDTNNATACPPGSDADLSSMKFLNEAIDQAKPDLIMLSGDQINGQGTTWAARSAIMKMSRIFENRTIPWTALFGNHDDEQTDATKEQQMSLMRTMPYFVGSAGPPTVDGVGNYLLRIKAADPSRTHLFSIYGLDSHTYANTLFSSSYDWIKESQIRWIKAESANISLLLRPYRPPDLRSEEGMFDIGGLLRRAAGRFYRRQADGQVLKKPNALAFWHIPLPEMDHDKGLPLDKNPVDGAPLMVGQALETSGGGPKHNSGFFAALQSMTEVGLKDQAGGSSAAALASNMAETYAALPEVKITAHGHQHVRASCERREGIWSCFAGGSTYSGYGRTYFDRRVRVFHISNYGERVETWQLVDSSATDTPVEGDMPTEAPPAGGIGASEAAAEEAELEEEILEELEAEGLVPTPGEPPRKRQNSGVVLQQVDRAVLVGPDALGA